MKADATLQPRGHAMGEKEFVFLVAFFMALTALAIDIMLPAMPAIADEFNLSDPNDRQAIITAYMLGFAAGHPIYGPLADRFGRLKPVLAALVLAFATSLMAAWAPDYWWMLVARFLQGVAGAGTRVIAIAVIRDRFGGRDMARVMSLVMSIFIIVPVVAPAIGGVLVAVGHWQWAYLAVAVMSFVLFVWSGLRLPESLKPENQLPLRLGSVARSMYDIAVHRKTFAYGAATGMMLSAIFSYLGSAQQIFGELYELGELFPIAFGSMALALVAASITNSRIVGRLGMRPISRTAGVVFTGVAAVHTIIAVWMGGAPPLYVFAPLLAVNLFLFGLMMPNLNSLAMEPHGHRAGTASAYLGFYTTAIGAVFGGFVGQAYDQSVVPLLAGYFCFGVVSLFFIWYADRDEAASPSHA